MNEQMLDTLVKRLCGAGVETFEYSGRGTRIRLHFAEVAAGKVDEPASTVEQNEPTTGQDQRLAYVGAPSVGFFQAQHPLEANPIVMLGDRVKEGQQIAFMVVDEQLYPVHAPLEGVLLDMCVKPGTLVGYGTNLFTIQS